MVLAMLPNLLDAGADWGGKEAPGDRAAGTDAVAQKRVVSATRLYEVEAGSALGGPESWASSYSTAQEIVNE